MGEKHQKIRLNLARATTEFDTHRDTLKKRLASVPPGPDGCWSILEIHRALSNTAELQAQKLRIATAEANLGEIKVKQAKGEFWPVAEIYKEWADRVIRIKEVINALPYPMEERAKILKQLAQAIK